MVSEPSFTSSLRSSRHPQCTNRLSPPGCAWVRTRRERGSSTGQAPSRLAAKQEYHPLMRVATGTVVSGKVVLLDSEIADGADVNVLTRDAGEAPKLSPEELAELEAGIAEADRGEMVSGEEFFKQLRRHG